MSNASTVAAANSINGTGPKINKGAITATDILMPSNLKNLFDKNTKAIIWGQQLKAIQVSSKSFFNNYYRE